MRVSLAGGTYLARSPASSAMRVLNLIPELAPPGEDAAPQPLYLAPGLTTQATATLGGSVRGMFYRGGTGNSLLVVIGGTVYDFNTVTNALTALSGTIFAHDTPVVMQGAGTGYVVIVDGSTDGWYVTPGNAVVRITDGAFQGGTQVVFLDTFLLFNAPGTNIWYAGPSNYAGNATPFDPLFIATKSTYIDLIAGIATVNQIVWIIGTETTELWYNSGAADFPFQRVPEVLFQHGTVAPYSISTMDGGVFFLSQDTTGQNVVMHGTGNQLTRISQYAVEFAIAEYSTTTDAIGYCYQQAGHSYYVLSFPTGDATWVYDLSTQLWHQRCNLDSSGGEHRHRSNCAAVVGGETYVGDYNLGIIYTFDLNSYRDGTGGQLIKRQAVFPHALNDGNRAQHWRFMADMSTPDPTVNAGVIDLDWSDDRGVTFGNPLTQPIRGSTIGSMTWWRLGTARDRVYRLTWTGPTEIMLQGCWLDITPAAS